jgi:hypothetical protein
MKALFRPSTRYLRRGRCGYCGRRHREDLPEVELLPGLTFENVQVTGVTWDDYCLFHLRQPRVDSIFGIRFFSADGFLETNHWSFYLAFLVVPSFLSV